MVIMKLTGHKTPAMFTRCSSLDDDDAREAVERLDSFLAAEKGCTLFAPKAKKST